MKIRVSSFPMLHSSSICKIIDILFWIKQKFIKFSWKIKSFFAKKKMRNFPDFLLSVISLVMSKKEKKKKLPSWKLIFHGECSSNLRKFEGTRREIIRCPQLRKSSPCSNTRARTTRLYGSENSRLIKCHIIRAKNHGQLNLELTKRRPLDHKGNKKKNQFCSQNS